MMNVMSKRRALVWAALPVSPVADFAISLNLAHRTLPSSSFHWAASVNEPSVVRWLMKKGRGQTTGLVTALTLLLRREEENLAQSHILKGSIPEQRYWHAYLSGVRTCKQFAHHPADATVTPTSLAPVKSRLL